MILTFLENCILLNSPLQISATSSILIGLANVSENFKKKITYKQRRVLALNNYKIKGVFSTFSSKMEFFYNNVFIFYQIFAQMGQSIQEWTK